MAQTFSITDFFNRFPTHDACLDHLMKVRFGETIECPKCGREGRFTRVRNRQVYQCAWCGHQVSPMVGTPFEKSRTPLQKWFYAMYLFTTTRHGVPAKELQRQLSVTYKTAWRMGHEIRKYMANVDGDHPLDDHVEVDETMIGGKPRTNYGKNPRGRGALGKTTVFGMLERGGDVMTRVVRDVLRKTLEAHILENVRTGTRISSDELQSYAALARHGYDHSAVNHSVRKYVSGDTHTNSIEGFWSMLKRSIRGTHVHVSAKHLPKYLGEFEYRYNMRENPQLMFVRLLLSFARPAG